MFPDKKPGDALGAGHINDLNAAARMIMYNGQGSHESRHKGTRANTPPWRQRTYVVIEKTYTGDEECDTSYEARSLYFDNIANQWLVNTDENPYCIDASAFGDVISIGDVVVAYWDPQRGTLIPIPTGTTTEGGTSSSSDCGCCDPTNCVSIPDNFLGDFEPHTYKITLPVGFNCECDSSDLPEGKIILRRIVDSTTTFRSRIFQCTGTPPTTESCTTTAHWIWTGDTGPCDTGTERSCTYVCVLVFDNPDPMPDTYEWQLTGQTCECDCYPTVNTPIDGVPPDAAHEGQTITTTSTCWESGPHWEFVSLDDSDCTCTLVQPDFDGSVIGQTATTDCTGTRPAGGTPTYLDSYWELRIAESGYYGCEYASVLDWIIGGAVRLRYTQANVCKPFCRLCENKFELFTCGPFDCENIPGVICVLPTLGYIDDGVPIVAGCCDEPVRLPEVYAVTIPDLPAVTNEPFTIHGTPDDVISFMCDQVQGTFLLYWDEDEVWWISDLIPFTHETAPDYSGFRWMLNLDLANGDCGLYIQRPSGATMVLQFEISFPDDSIDCSGTLTFNGINNPSGGSDGCTCTTDLVATAEPVVFSP